MSMTSWLNEAKLKTKTALSKSHKVGLCLLTARRIGTRNGTGHLTTHCAELCTKGICMAEWSIIDTHYSKCSLGEDFKLHSTTWGFPLVTSHESTFVTSIGLLVTFEKGSLCFQFGLIQPWSHGHLSFSHNS